MELALPVVAPGTPPPPPAESLASPTDEIADALCRSVADFAAAHIDAARIDADKRIPPAVLKGLAELGLFGVTLPEAHGGAGLPATTACRAVATLAEADRSVATTVGLHLGLGTRGLVAYGTPEAQARFLPGLASGEHLAAFATTESGAGSDLAAIATRGVLDGEHLRLNGQKIYVTNGALARVLTATVSTPGLGGAERGISVVALDSTSPGVTVLGEEHKLGLRGSSTTTIMLDDARLPLSQVLGVPGKGAEYLAHILSWGRMLLSAGCVGTARKALKLATAHVHERRQFGKPLAAQEVVQRQLSGLATRLFAMRALVEAAARAEADVPTLARLTSSAKVLCSEGAWAICDTSLQLHGGCGYIEDTGVALLLRDARVPRIFEGANDVLLTHLGLMELAQAQPLAGARSAASAAVAELRAGLLARHGGVRVMGKKADQHRLGLACAWRDGAEAAQALAARQPSASWARLAAAVEALALQQVQAAAADVRPTDTLTVAALAEGDIP
jgi:alkylation response protein AidB-like acyl-CoA dehydrogenase